MSSVEVGQAVRAIASARSDTGPEVLLCASLPARPDQCSVARKLVVSVLADWSDEPETVDAVVWALSELFANGLDHHPIAEGERLRISLIANVGPAGRWFALSVTDGGGGSLCSRKDGVLDQDEDGRGLDVIRGFGAKITDEVFDSGYQVTAWLAETKDLRSHVCQCDCLAWGHLRDEICTWTVSAEDRQFGSCGPCAERIEHVTTMLTDGRGQQADAVPTFGQARSC